MQIVALANIYPSEDGVSELDSFMYQTVGHQLIEAYAECTGLPLFRIRTHGKSHSQVELQNLADTRARIACELHTLRMLQS